MARNKHQKGTPEQHVLDTQREYNRRDWARKQQDPSSILRDPLPVAAIPPVGADS